MDIEVNLLVWNEIKEHILSSDRTEASEDFVRVLVEHGADINDIAEYAIDSDIKKALLEYGDLEEHHQEEEYY